MADSKSSAQVGLTPAGFPVIDSTAPTELEIQQEIAFNDWFRMEVEKDHSSEVRIAQDAQRNRVLEFVQDSVQTTVKSLFKAQFPDAPLPPLDELAVVLPYGSFRIDVHDAHSDMDIVAVVPEWVRREALFEGFRSCLSSCADCSCVQVLLSARAPVLKFVMFSFSVDVAVAILIYDRVPNPFSPQALIENVVDEKSALALVGPSNSDALLELVPDPERFRQLLRFIKLWAKNNFIYSNAFGFLGGMAWSLLCAFICQIYPRATVPALVARFFKVMKGWNWIATEVCVSPPQPISKWGGWSRHNGRDRALVHIITPVAPLQNSAFNVSQSALGIMTKRMWDAGKCFPFESFAGDNGSRQMLGCFSRALAKQNFFATYQRFIIFEVCSPSQDDHIGWRGLIESQLRKLISLVQDTVEQVQYLHPYPCAIDPPDDESLMPNCFPPVPTASTPTDTASASSPSASAPGSSDESVKLLSSKARFRTWFAIGIRVRDVKVPLSIDLHNPVRSFIFGLPDRIPRFAKCSYNVVVKARKDLPACIRPVLPHETRYNLPSVFVLRHSHAHSVASASQGAGLKLPPAAAGVVAVKRPLPEAAVDDPADAVASKTTAVGHETNGRSSLDGDAAHSSKKARSDAGEGK